jgi:hypothetical protein
MKDLNSALFIHVKRALNEEVHLLAKSFISLNSSEVFYCAPDCIWKILCIDVI